MGKNMKEFDGSNSYDKQDKWWTALKKSINQARGVKPTTVIGQDDWRTQFYRDQIRTIIKGIMEVKVSEKYGDKWDMDYFKDVLLFGGKICICDTNAGVLPLRCGLFGQNVFERSSGIRVDNPIVGSYEFTLGKDAEVIFLMDDLRYKSFEPLVEIYACKLAMCDSSIDINLLNSKVAYVIDCNSSKQANEAKMIYDKINAGEPAVFWESGGDIGSTMQFFKNDVKGSFVIDMIQDAKRAIVNELLTIIGVNNNAVEKKERLLFDEVNGNNLEVQCNMKYVKEMVDRGVKRVNKMFDDVELSITFPFYEESMRQEAGDKNDESNGRTDIYGSNGTRRRVQ